MQQPALLALSLHFPREQRSRRQPALGRGHRRGSAPTAFLLAGIVLCPPRGRVSQETAPESSSDTFPASRATLFGLSPRHMDGSTRPLCARSVSSLYRSHQTHCERLRRVHCSLQQPPPAAGAVGSQPWQKTPFCCLLPVSDSSLLLFPPCVSRPFPGLLPAQPARRSLCHTRWNRLDAHTKAN